MRAFNPSESLDISSFGARNIDDDDAPALLRSEDCQRLLRLYRNDAETIVFMEGVYLVSAPRLCLRQKIATCEAF